MKKYLLAVTLLVTLFSPLARAQRGFYLGSDIGQTTTSGYGNSSDFGFFAGGGFSRHFAVQLGYHSLMGYEMTLLDASVVGRWRLAKRLHLLASLGLAYWTESPTGLYKASGTDPAYGLGLSYRFARDWSLRGSYQVVQNSSGHLGTNLDTLGIGVVYHFP